MCVKFRGLQQFFPLVFQQPFLDHPHFGCTNHYNLSIIENLHSNIDYNLRDGVVDPFHEATVQGNGKLWADMILDTTL